MRSPGSGPSTFSPMKTVRPSPARARLTSAWYPAMIPLASSAFTRRRHADGESADRVRQVDVGDPAVLLQARHDGTIHLVWNMVWHKNQPSARYRAI